MTNVKTLETEDIDSIESINTEDKMEEFMDK